MLHFIYTLLIVTIAGSTITGCGKSIDQLEHIAPTVLPNTERAMKSPGFWVALNPEPDAVVMTPESIAQFNKHITDELGLTKDLTQIIEYDGAKLKEILTRDLDGFRKRKLLDNKGKPVKKDFYEQIAKSEALDQIPDKISAKYVFLAAYTDQRLLPIDDALTEKPGDTDFDELQNSSFDPGTPMVVLAATENGQWIYGFTHASSGWVKSRNAIFCSFEEFKEYQARPFVVITSAKADLFLNDGMTDYYDYARMGTKYPLNSVIEGLGYEIVLPGEDDNGEFVLVPAFIKLEDASIGCLPYTPRVIMDQAFKMLGAQYGWGGFNGEQDCSSFIQQLFKTVGIELPRNSSAQGSVGEVVASFDEKIPAAEKLEVIRTKAVGGITIMQMKGHIVLYLGTYDGTPYIIHEAHGYSEHFLGGDTARIVNRVVVTDLSLGTGTKKGAFLGRIKNIKIIK